MEFLIIRRINLKKTWYLSCIVCKINHFWSWIEKYDGIRYYK